MKQQEERREQKTEERKQLGGEQFMTSIQTPNPLLPVNPNPAIYSLKTLARPSLPAAACRVLQDKRV